MKDKKYTWKKITKQAELYIKQMFQEEHDIGAHHNVKDFKICSAVT